MKKSIFIIVFGLLLGLSACRPDTDPYEDYTGGYLRNFTGLDGCGWVIVLDDSSRLEPTNLASFSIPLIDNQKIKLKYHNSPNGGSFCMIGPVVDIEDIVVVR